MNQTSDENNEKYHLGIISWSNTNVWTSIIRIVPQTARSNDEILNERVNYLL